MISQSGLSSEQAASILKKDGPNEVVPSSFKSNFDEIKKLLMDPMGLMLLSLAALQGFVGEKTDAFILLAAYVPVTAVDVLLELRAQRALRAMRSTLSSTAKVLRDGQVTEVSIKNIVVGDVLIFEEGQALPADGIVLESSGLSVNESALTGESIPVDKNPGNYFFAGTTVMLGRGLGLIHKTGKYTQFGKIATLLELTEDQQSPLQKKVNHVIKRILILALLLAVFLFVLELARGHSLFESLIIALTFGMSAVPEEFSLVFTLYLSFGAWRLSEHGVLIRTLPSVEALGSVDVICTDKTGTLTEGNFQLDKPWILNSSTSTDQIWQMALMACEEKAVDNMEMAIKEKGRNYNHLLHGWHLHWDYPFEGVGKHMSHVWISDQQNSKHLIAMKGAVEGVLEHCDISGQDKECVHQVVASFASQGRRILGLAAREGLCTGDRRHDETGLQFLGLLLFNDVIRESAKEAIMTCQDSGITVKMLTGDHPLTAHAVADLTGIKHSHDSIYTGQQLALMCERDKENAYQQGAIFSRVLPEQKQEMVRALKKSGKVVAMTGDGINDAPALKLADIGISMGLSATDVARSTAQMILVKNDFKGLVEAVFEGRRIFANLRRSFSYLVAFHIPVILLALVPPLLGWGELLLPIHIVLLELIVHPISAFAFENLSLPKGEIEKSILPKKYFWRSSVAGILLSVIALVLFWVNINPINPTPARSYAMLAIFIGNMFFVLMESGFNFGRRVLATICCLILFCFAIFQIEPLARLLHLGF